MGGKGPEEIRGFVKKVKEKFRPAVIILFGSRARGEGLKHSDYDLVVVSPKFEGMPFLERLSRLYGLGIFRPVRTCWPTPRRSSRGRRKSSGW